MFQELYIFLSSKNLEVLIDNKDDNILVNNFNIIFGQSCVAHDHKCSGNITLCMFICKARQYLTVSVDLENNIDLKFHL